MSLIRLTSSTIDGQPSRPLFIDPETVTCISPARDPGLSMVYHGTETMHLVIGDPAELYATLFPEVAE